MGKLEQHLTEMKELMARGWCQHMTARAASGEDAVYEDAGAVSFYSIGASKRVADAYRPDYDPATVSQSFVDAVPTEQRPRMPDDEEKPDHHTDLLQRRRRTSLLPRRSQPPAPAGPRDGNAGGRASR